MYTLITGASGFIGSALIKELSLDEVVVGVDVSECNFRSNYVKHERLDVTDLSGLSYLLQKHPADIIIHCAAIAHQKIGSVDASTYLSVNSEATENLAKAASKRNSSLCFVFLSSISVYGENNFKELVSEDDKCLPSSDYARSKLDAERRLIRLFDEGHFRHLIILRLAPVYDREWSLNLDRRVFCPKRLFYLRFGTGAQKMSALARPNLIDFIQFLTQRLTQSRTNTQSELANHSLQIYNVCDEKPYSFNQIIHLFRKSDVHPNRPVISVPLSPVWLATRVAGIFFSGKKDWIHSCYDKLGSSLVFNNTRMMKTGFKTKHSLETIFHPAIP